jgi:hypothetical protein
MFDCRGVRVPNRWSPRVFAGTACALAVALASLTTGVARAARSTPTALSTVHAVNVDSGRIAGVAVVRARGRYRLRVPAGAYLVVFSKIHANGGSRDRVRGLAVVRKAAREVVGQTAAARPVVTIGTVTLGRANLGALVLRDLFNPLTNRGITFVDTSGQVVAAAKREQQLWDDGRLATPVTYNPLQPTYEITGDGTQSRNGQVTMTLSLKNLVTGQVVATKTVTGKGRTFGQLDGVFDDLTSEFADDAGQVIDESPTGGAVTVDLSVTFITEGAGGTGSVTASPPGHTFSQSDDAIYEYKVAGGTTVSLSAKPDAGSYFLGWQSGSECGTIEFENQDLVYPCTVTDPGDGHFAIRPGANFAKCPPPGTFIFNAINATVCPGVTVMN